VWKSWSCQMKEWKSKEILNLHEDILKGYQRRPEKLNCYMMIILKIYVAVDVFQVPN